MNENISPFIIFDEAPSFLLVKPLDFTLCHNTPSFPFGENKKPQRIRTYYPSWFKNKARNLFSIPTCSTNSFVLTRYLRIISLPIGRSPLSLLFQKIKFFCSGVPLIPCILSKSGYRCQQGFRIRMLRVVKQLLITCHFDNTSPIHDGNPVTYEAYNPHVMRNKNIG
jgi:hypothetical protein